jgi:hypothetical protein
MSLLTKPVNEISEDDVEALRGDRFAECKTVEYKEALSVDGEANRIKFLSQVSSFANASGGHLIYGIRAKQGVPQTTVGLDVSDPDGLILRLEHMVRDGIRPRIPGLQSVAVRLRSGQVVVVMRIPKSWASPHQVTFNNEYRFYSRSSNGKYPLDVDELRSLFTLSATAAEHVRSFRAARLSNIVAEETPVVMDRGPRFVLHLVPLGAFETASKVDLSSIAAEYSLLSPLDGSGFNGILHNFDGVYTDSGQISSLAHDHERSYLQVFRSGAIEAVSTSMSDIEATIANVYFEKVLRNALSKYLTLQRRLGIEPPIVVMLSLLGVKGYHMLVRESRAEHGHPIDRDNLLVPEVLVENFDTTYDWILKQISDPVWNAAGFPASPNFDPDRNWTGR